MIRCTEPLFAPAPSSRRLSIEPGSGWKACRLSRC